MKRILLALPLFLVVGLAFVDLPNGNSTSSNVSTVSVGAPIQAGSASAQVTLPTATQPSVTSAKNVKSKVDLGGGKQKQFTDDDEGSENDD